MSSAVVVAVRSLLTASAMTPLLKHADRNEIPQRIVFSRPEQRRDRDLRNRSNQQDIAVRQRPRDKLRPERSPAPRGSR